MTTSEENLCSEPGFGLVTLPVDQVLAQDEVAEGVLGTEYDRADRSEVQNRVRDAEEAAKDEVWASYRFVALADTREGARAQGHRPRRRPLQRERNALRAGPRCVEGRGSPFNGSAAALRAFDGMVAEFNAFFVG